MCWLKTNTNKLHGVTKQPKLRSSVFIKREEDYGRRTFTSHVKSLSDTPFSLLRNSMSQIKANQVLKQD